MYKISDYDYNTDWSNDTMTFGLFDIIYIFDSTFSILLFFCIKLIR